MSERGNGRRSQIEENGRPWQFGVYFLFAATLFARTESMVWRVLSLIVMVFGGPIFLYQMGRYLRRRIALRAEEESKAGERPIVGIDPRDRGDWIYSQSTGESTQIELRLHRHRYVARFGSEEKGAYRTVLSGITDALNSGTEQIDVNAAFATKIGREPFEHHGPLPPTVVDRVFRKIR